MNEIDSSLALRQGKTGPGNRAKCRKIHEAVKMLLLG